MTEPDRIKKIQKKRKKGDPSNESKYSQIYHKIVDIGFILLLILGIPGAILFLVFFPYIFVYISGGMPEPLGTRIAYDNASQINQRGDILQLENIEIAITDAFTCREYGISPRSIIVSSVTYYPKDSFEFAFIGISAKFIQTNGSTSLPGLNNIFLLCDGNLTPGFLPTDGSPFFIYKFENRNKINFLPFAATPYGYSMLFKQNITEIQSGYLTYAKPINLPFQDCKLIISNEHNNKPLIWSLSEF
jgi:hypothetical protein